MYLSGFKAVVHPERRRASRVRDNADEERRRRSEISQVRWRSGWQSARATGRPASRYLDYEHYERVDIGQLIGAIGGQVDRLRLARAQIDDGIPWYPYDILANVVHVNATLTGPNRDLESLAQGLPVADIGAADGDLAFALENLAGWQIDIIDTAATNMNGLRGARALRDRLGSRVEIHDIDLDSQFGLPRERYGLVFLLGILYHLQNPYYVLRELAARSSYCLLSTKVARFAGPDRAPIGDLPVGYLVAPDETNNDPTNYWIFTPFGLERLVQRAGWSIMERLNIGDTAASDPSTPENDERMFMLLRSSML